MRARLILLSGARPTVLKRAANQPSDIERMTTMSDNNIIATVREIRELESLIDEAKARQEVLRDQVKRHMGDREMIKAGEYTIRWQYVVSTRLDTGKIKALFSPEDLEGFTQTTMTRRFSIA